MFKKLKTLILIKTGITWKVLRILMESLNNIEELVLCRNNLGKGCDFTAEDLPNLKFLDLEENNILRFADILSVGNLKSLEKLNINRNEIDSFGKFTGFEKLKILSFENNKFEDRNVLTEFKQFTCLEEIRLKYNPFIKKYDDKYIWQRSIAEIKVYLIFSLILNFNK